MENEKGNTDHLFKVYLDHLEPQQKLSIKKANDDQVAYGLWQVAKIDELSKWKKKFLNKMQDFQLHKPIKLAKATEASNTDIKVLYAMIY